jgi:hypothetical protein
LRRPATPLPEPNGIRYDVLRDTLDAIAARTHVIGFDFVEVNPQLDAGTGITAYLGAHTLIEFLGRICAQDWWRERREKWPVERGGRRGRGGLRPPAAPSDERCHARFAATPANPPRTAAAAFDLTPIHPQQNQDDKNGSSIPKYSRIHFARGITALPANGMT